MGTEVAFAGGDVAGGGEGGGVGARPECRGLSAEARVLGAESDRLAGL